MAQMGSVKGYVGLKWPSGWSRGGGTGSDRIDCRVYMGSKGVVWCVCVCVCGAEMTKSEGSERCGVGCSDRV